MANIRFPRSGTMQFWPRKRAKRIYARVRSRPKVDSVKLLEFAGYKVGMVHALVLDLTPNSMTKNEEKTVPLTIIECPPLKIASVRFYKKTNNGLKIVSECFVGKDKDLLRKVPKVKKQKSIEEFEPKLEEFDDITILVYTQPKKSGVRKKKPEIFEVKLSGSVKEKYNFIKERINKEINVEEVFTEGVLVDVHAVTKGKGIQGPVKRFGIALKSHKSQKGQRAVGSLGPWNAQAHILYRVAHAGQTGFHQRTEYNKLIVKIVDPKEIEKKSGYEHYGQIHEKAILLKGSVPGAKKRLIRMVQAIRPNKKKQEQLQLIKIIK